MAGVKYRGLDPRTRPLRWGLYALALTGVLVATGPMAIKIATGWLASELDKLPWYGTRLLGMLSYGALALSVIYGLLLSTGLLDAIAHRAVSFTLHRDLAATGLGLGMVHGALLLLDRTVPYSVGQLVVPFAGPYRPLWVGVGQVVLYLMAIVYVSFYVRRQIGQRSWRLLHYVTLLVFFGATAHGLMSGSDTSARWAFWAYVMADAAVVFLVGYRISLSIATRLFGPGNRVHPTPRSMRPRMSTSQVDAPVVAVRTGSAGPDQWNTVK
jgi:methionine sulfoxide reductase heme-binding subunit